MKEEFKEIFKGIFNNLPLNIFCVLGIGFFTILLWDMKELKFIEIIDNNPFNSIINYNPPLFWISFFVGFLWSNSFIKEIHIFTMNKILVRFPIILVWLLAILLL